MKKKVAVVKDEDRSENNNLPNFGKREPTAIIKREKLFEPSEHVIKENEHKKVEFNINITCKSKDSDNSKLL